MIKIPEKKVTRREEHIPVDINKPMSQENRDPSVIHSLQRPTTPAAKFPGKRKVSLGRKDFVEWDNYDETPLEGLKPPSPVNKTEAPGERPAPATGLPGAPTEMPMGQPPTAGGPMEQRKRAPLLSELL